MKIDKAYKPEKCVSSDPERGNLHHVYLDDANGELRVVATDAQCIVAFPVERHTDEQAILGAIPQEALTAARKGRAGANLDLSSPQNARVETSLWPRPQLVGEGCPDWRKAIPPAARAEVRIAVDVRLLKRVADAFGTYHVVLGVSPNADDMLIRVLHRDDPRVLAAVASQRLRDVERCPTPLLVAASARIDAVERAELLAEAATREALAEAASARTARKQLAEENVELRRMLEVERKMYREEKPAPELTAPLAPPEPLPFRTGPTVSKSPEFELEQAQAEVRELRAKVADLERDFEASKQFLRDIDGVLSTSHADDELAGAVEKLVEQVDTLKEAPEVADTVIAQIALDAPQVAGRYKCCQGYASSDARGHRPKCRWSLEQLALRVEVSS
jgi:hypothetical protein